jgi:hypothetical protein
MTYLEKAKELRAEISPLLDDGKTVISEVKQAYVEVEHPNVLKKLHGFFDVLNKNKPEVCDIVNIVSIFFADSKMSAETENKLHKFVWDAFEDWQLQDEETFGKK